jgi:hypothetical protein
VPRNMRLCVLLACLMCVGVREAAAGGDGWWGWLEEFSGPGPFKGPFFGSSLGENFCSNQNKFDLKSLRAGTQAGRWVPCIWADQRFFRARPSNEPGRVFPEVQASLYDFGVSVSHDYVFSIGAGAGFVRFSSTTPTEDLKKTRFTVTPIRVTLSPWTMLSNLSKSSPDRWKQALGAVKWYGKVICFPGELRGADFGVPNSTYRNDGECNLSHGLQFDVLDLVGLTR